MENITSTYIPFKIAAIKKRKRLTRRILQLQADWDNWKQPEFKQLDQYLQQHYTEIYEKDYNNG